MTTDPERPGVGRGTTPGVLWRKKHLLRRRITDLLDHAEALEHDVEHLLTAHALNPEQSYALHRVMQLRAKLTELDRVMRAYARDRGENPDLTRLAQLVHRPAWPLA